MKIAVALFGERVSPHFLTAPELLLLVTQEGKVRCSWKAQIEGLSPRQRIRRLVSLGVDMLLCGGIDAASQSDLERRGIRVVPNASGDPLLAVQWMGGIEAAEQGPLGSPAKGDGHGPRPRGKKW